MKRDLNLARLILLKAEDCEDPWGLQDPLEIDGYNNNQISYHIKLLHQAGLIEGSDCSGCGPDGFVWIVDRLTWRGHDFLDASKDDTMWNKAKDTVLKPSASFTFDLLLEWLKNQASQKLGLP